MSKHAGEFSMSWPDWVPDPVRRYISHTVSGGSIRAVARDDNNHASTVLRQVRQIEGQRDDDLIDNAVAWLVDLYAQIEKQSETSPLSFSMLSSAGNRPEFRTVTENIPLALRALSQPGAVLAMAQGMDMAVIVRDRDEHETLRLGVVEQPVVYALVLNKWVSCDANGRIRRFQITQSGRAYLNTLVAASENRASGFSEAQKPFEKLSKYHPARRPNGATDSPVSALARRRDSRGAAFLPPELVRAAQRIQDDFELAQMEPGLAVNWTHFLSSGASGTGRGEAVGQAPSAARDRVVEALRALGPGLSDVVLECCCRLEGLEAAEKKLGWSARSGKIVLRIALQRLQRHYDAIGDSGGLIG